MQNRSSPQVSNASLRGQNMSPPAQSRPWELSGDDAKDTLVKTLRRTLRPAKN